jgi:hypothetical protein
MIEFNLHVDVMSRELVEEVSGLVFENIPIEDVNSFLSGLFLFHEEGKKEYWKNLS